MDNKIKIVIADDNVYLCEMIKKEIENYDEVQILGIANTDEEEIRLIEELKPEIVITDLMRKRKYSGWDIIKKYDNREDTPRFLIVSAGWPSIIINKAKNVEGFIQRPYTDKNIIIEELRRICKKRGKTNS